MTEANINQIEKETNPLKLHPKLVKSKLAISWITQALQIFKTYFASMLAIGCLFLLSMLLLILPFGVFLFMLAAPILIAGTMDTLDLARTNGHLSLGSMSNGFRKSTGTLLGLGGAQIGMFFAAVIIVAIVFSVLLGPYLQDMPRLEAATVHDEVAMNQYMQDFMQFFSNLYQQHTKEYLIVLLVYLALLLPISMMMMYAPALAILHKQTVGHAMTKSLVACVKNFVPFLLYGLLLFLLMLVVDVILMLLMQIITSTGFAIALSIVVTIILIPYILITIYLSYRDIFLPEEVSEDIASAEDENPVS